MEKCLICQYVGAEEDRSGKRDSYLVTCNTCGRYEYFHTRDYYEWETWTERQRAVLGYALRQKQRDEAMPSLDPDWVRLVHKRDFLPDVFEQIENLILLIGDRQETISRSVEIDFPQAMYAVGTIAHRDVMYLASNIVEDGIAAGTISSANFNLMLTVKGWERYHSIRKGITESRRAFMAMKFGDEEMDKLFEDTWQPAVGHTGFELHRIDKKPKAGSIINRMRDEIRRSKFILADLTHGNQGAYWEAGFGEGLGKPVIYLCKAEQFKEMRHFDVNQQMTVKWDAEKPEEAAEELKLIIRNSFPSEAKMED